jgi:hypothetical protein
MGREPTHPLLQVTSQWPWQVSLPGFGCDISRWTGADGQSSGVGSFTQAYALHLLSAPKSLAHRRLDHCCQNQTLRVDRFVGSPSVSDALQLAALYRTRDGLERAYIGIDFSHAHRVERLSGSGTSKGLEIVSYRRMRRK